MSILRALAIGIAIFAIGLAYNTRKKLPPPPDVQETECGSVGNACVVGDRSYNLLLPRGDGPFPAVIFLHGSGSNGAAVISNSTITTPLLNRGYALIAPTGLDVKYSGNETSSGWIWEGRRNGRDDYRYLRKVISDVTGRFEIDPDKIVVAGHSNGATMVWYLACAGFDRRLKFFAPISGTPVRGWRRPCSRNQPEFSLLHMHGASDTVVPFKGTQPNNGFTGWLGAQEAVEDIANRARCKLSKQQGVPEATTTNWSDCIGQSQFRVALVPGGHSVPKAWGDTMLDWYEALNPN